MAKRPPPGKCVHCLKQTTQLTWDHVFPKAWYPNTTQPNIKKWKIPACPSCNSDYGKLEEDLLWRLGLSVDPEEQKSLGITNKVLRATQPRYAKNERDGRLRTAKLKSIVEQLIKSDSVPKEGILPNFGPLPGLKYESYAAIPISEDSLVKLGQKIVKGITYLVYKSFIDETYKINVYFVEDDKAKEVVRTIEAHGATHDRGPGIVVKHALASEGGLVSLWLIEIWGRLKMYSTVIPMQLPNQAAT